MTPASPLWVFVVVVGVLTVTPGVDTALILRTAVRGDARSAWGVVAGIQSGTLMWGICTAAGLSSLLTASHLAYETLRWVGVAYLAWIGLGLLRCAGRGGPDVTDQEPDLAAGSFARGWRRGALTNVLNPKMGAFYVALLPQFIPASSPHLTWGVLLAGIHVALGTVWSTLLIVFARRLRRVLQRPTARRVLDLVAGSTIVGFGVRLAVSDRAA